MVSSEGQGKEPDKEGIRPRAQRDRGRCAGWRDVGRSQGKMSAHR